MKMKMKKIVSVLLAVLLMSTLCLNVVITAKALDANIISLCLHNPNAFVNGNSVAIDDGAFPLTIDKHTVIPVRFVSERLNAEVVYNDEKKTVDIGYKGSHIFLEIGSSVMKLTKQGQTTEVPLPTPAIIINSKTYLPLRIISETFGWSVFYNQDYHTIVISDRFIPNYEVKNQHEIASRLEFKNIKITGLSMNEPSGLLYLGKKVENLVTVTPSNATMKNMLKYSSSNPEVASVNSKGEVKLLKEGQATITVTDLTSTFKTEITLNPRDYYNEKLIALTFDDGPHKTLTPKLLDILAKNDVKATFYVIGLNVKSNPQVVKRAYDEGHQIGNHTYNHKYLTSLSAANRTKEINSVDSLILEYTGVKTTTLRPPGGAINNSVAATINKPVIMWSVDPQDWRNKNSTTVYNRVIKNTTDGSIILLHDIYPTTITAAENIIPELKKRGYTFVTVDELIEIRGTRKNGQIYKSLPKK